MSTADADLRDPVCGMRVSESAPHRHPHAGRTYYFCNPGCKARFDAAAWSRWSREFVGRWDGSGVDTELVDPDALLAAWSADVVDSRAYALLQAAWLRNEGPRFRETSTPVGSRDSS